MPTPSLLIVPARFKSGKLYSQIPTSGAGDFTVTRATSATRVNASGLIEVQKTNLALQSSDYSLTWLTASVNSTSGVLSPSGTNDATLFEATVNTARVRQTITLTSGTTYTFSWFGKFGSLASGFTMNVFDENATTYGSGVCQAFNLNEGTLGASGTVGAGFTLQSVGMENYGNDWYRCRMTVLMSYTPATPRVGMRLGTELSGGRPISVVSGTVNVWGAQLETGTSASEYIPTTTVARTRFAGVTVDGTVATNIPRLDYFASSGTVGCPALLVEPSGSNLALRSAGFEVSGTWAPTNANVTTGTTTAFTAPDNSADADLLTSTTNGSSFVGQSVAIASGTYTISVFGKAGTSHIFSLGNVSRNLRGAWFNLNAGTVTGTVNGGTASMQNYGNGWYRCIYTSSGMVSGTATLIVGLADAANGLNATSGTNLYVWGAQLETGSVATSYIPTTTAAVTRNAEVITVSGAVSGSIGQLSGTIYAEVDVRNISGLKAIIQLDNGTGDNRLLIQLSSPNTLTFFTTNGGSVSTIATGTITTGTHKIAASYSSGTVQIYMDGLFLASGNTANYPSLALNNISIGSRIFSGVQGNFLNDRIRAAALYTTRLTNAELAALTTP